ncbi:hypothetical protein [Candidatus Mycobacterium methanotrophicum]|uniref:Wadjet protein JetD C-terminal domain-containing protein n=1 Tax=Candidatus Mycobacterium methanotrophicum TaxID=2943498 RepID=A0ABY4QHC1_9MYCO|nr:hypothetical protein [Candidatus Mycobacterium methanotrophicum]UQX09607.1 hypothetical protein M5I08_14700 [Candidatus Mycobacterium methanotrophicum]
MSTKTDEQRVRRMAKRQGISLAKSRDDSSFMLHDDVNGGSWAAQDGGSYGLTLAQCEAWLLQRDPSTGRQTRDWTRIVREAGRIVEGYDTSVTLRQLFYRLVSRELISNTENDYNYLSAKTAEARRQGLFPALVDQTSNIVVPQTFSSPDDARSYLSKSYCRDRTAGQEVSLYLGTEKAGFKAQLWESFGDFGIPILPLGGYASQTYVDGIAEHADRQRRPAVLIYAGDFDGSGEDIYRDFVQRTDCWTEHRQIALTPEQIEEYQLPVLPGKETDTRSKDHALRHGFDSAVQVEMDALDPTVLRGLYQGAIDDFWDDDAYDAAVAAEDADRAVLGGLVDRQAG